MLTEKKKNGEIKGGKYHGEGKFVAGQAGAQTGGRTSKALQEVLADLKTVKKKKKIFGEGKQSFLEEWKNQEGKGGKYLVRKIYFFMEDKKHCQTKAQRTRGLR